MTNTWLLWLLLVFVHILGDVSGQQNPKLVSRIENALERVLDFSYSHHKSLNTDGVFGIALANGKVVL